MTSLKAFKFAIVWTAFFSVIGIIIQSLREGSFIILPFFYKNLINWFSFFNAIINQTTDLTSYLYGIITDWYYFFFLGGVLALLWFLIYYFFSFLFWLFSALFRSVQKKSNSIIVETQKPIVQEEKQPEGKEEEPENLASELRDKKDFNDTLSQWLEEGLLLLSEGKMSEAELIYEEIRRQYNSSNTKDPILYERINSFYKELLDLKSRE